MTNKIAETFVLEYIKANNKHKHKSISDGLLEQIINKYPIRFTRAVSHGRKTDTVLDEVINEAYGDE